MSGDEADGCSSLKKKLEEAKIVDATIEAELRENTVNVTTKAVSEAFVEGVMKETLINVSKVTPAVVGSS